MNKEKKSAAYKVFCILALIMSVYLTVHLWVSQSLDAEILVIILLFAIVTIWGIFEWKINYDAVARLEKDLKMYSLYIKPMEELSKEIRAKQHEFDNHINAIVNMHVTIDNYDELVAEQSKYADEIRNMNGRKLIPLLRISDKILAGFLYSKLLGVDESIEVDIQVMNYDAISSVSEHQLIEIIGTLVDNAIEACDKVNRHIIMILDSVGDKMIFEIKNQVSGIKLGQIEKFFEKGFSTKGNNNRGLGLYNAKKIAKKNGGDIMVSTQRIDEKSYISFTVEL